jgi:hypothetical protein
MMLFHLLERSESSQTPFFLVSVEKRKGKRKRKSLRTNQTRIRSKKRPISRDKPPFWHPPNALQYARPRRAARIPRTRPGLFAQHYLLNTSTSPPAPYPTMMPPTVDIRVNPNVPRYTPPKRGAGDAMSTATGPFQAGLDSNVPLYTPSKRGACDATATVESAVFQDALFMLAVRPKDTEQNGDALPLFQSIMPSDSVVASDQRGGLAARAPSRGVQLLTKHNVSAALYSQHDSLLASDLIDQFIGHRDSSSNDPRARANALRAWLKRLHDDKHVFSLALFDDSGRAFAAWTPHSAPLSFGHADDGSAVVIAAAPHKRTLVGAGCGGQINLTHLPAGRFVYGHGYLKPFEFTSLWSTAEGNRGGALRVMRTVDTRASPDAPPVDDHRLSAEEKKKWRWDVTGSVAEQAKRWTSAIAAAPATPERVSSKVSPPLSVDAPAFSAKTSSSFSLSAADAATASTRRLDFAIGVWAHFAFRGGLARVNRYDQRPDKRFLTLLLMRQAVFVDGKNSRVEKSNQHGAALGEALATLRNKSGGVSVRTEKNTQTQVVPNAHSARSVRLGLIAAVKRAARDSAKRKSQKDLVRRLAAPARVTAGAENKASSVVVCDLNGRCCVGDHCFFA